MADSNIRCDVRLSRVTGSTSKGDAYVDMITYEHTWPDTWDREASLPGIFCDIVEAKKRNKHFLSVEASDSHNEFVLFAINDYGGIGPQAEAFIESLASIKPRSGGAEDTRHAPHRGDDDGARAPPAPWPDQGACGRATGGRACSGRGPGRRGGGRRHGADFECG